MPYADLETGILHLSSEITYERAVDFLTAFRHMEQSAKVQSITVHVLSHGGSLMPSIGIAQALKTCTKPVHTVGIGYIASGAVPILAAGNKGQRRLIQGSKIVMHEPASQMTPVSQKGPGLPTWESEIALLKETFSSYYWMLEKASSKPASFWQDLLEGRPDRLISEREALELGLIDTVVLLK